MKLAHEKLLVYQVNRNKDPEAFSGLYDLYVDDIFKFVFYKVSNWEQAEDLTSEVFLKTWQKISRSDEEIKNIRALFYKIARNLIIDFYRQSGKEKNISLNEVVVDDRQLVVDEQQLDEFQLSGDKIVLNQALQKLKEDYREAIVLKYINEFSVAEIAEVMQRSKGSVRVLIHRALKALREILK